LRFVLFAGQAIILCNDLSEEREMPVAATEKKTKTFHATVQVTRLEEWRVEAETVEEARAMFLSGSGHRCGPGECIHLELDQLREV
jgi:hypothetical protein